MKTKTILCCRQETHLNYKDRRYLRIKNRKKFFQSNGPKKQAGVAILISNKIDFPPKLIIGDGEVLFIFINGKIR